ncbi:signal peptidase II [Spiractinospora alimapuensis]|uniref:signal peptidase II n=1 Tax=Spiractinospora alimapuensis TaxID=2820884 RepID=UPI0022AB3180|nr:signal peptidase II [Spiractinospora alimapuensis]QVQ54681.1 signal peptidase II [Spiractinospora alimapuensis]
MSTEQEPPEGTEDANDDTATAQAPRRLWLFGGLALVAVALDFATKEIALSNYSAHDPVELLGGFLTLTLVFNSGAAFSIGQGFPWVFTIIATIVVVAILRAAFKLRSVGWAIALGLVLGGAVGNLIDRFFREPAPLQGHVIDWIQVPNWPVFNLADSAIVCGGVLAVLLAFFGVNLDGTRDARKKDRDADASASEKATTPSTRDEATDTTTHPPQAGADTPGDGAGRDDGQGPGGSDTSTRDDRHG